MVQVDKFSFGEMTSSANGKTSMPLVMGMLIIATGCSGFMWAVITKYSEGVLHSVAVIALGTGLLGIRRFTKDKELSNEVKSEGKL